MLRIPLIVCLHSLLSTDVLALTFDSPPSGGANVTIAENKAVGSDIYTPQATDPAGNLPVFTILTQNPSTPAFSIDHSSDSLIVPSQGLDAETTAVFNFTFRVTAGSATADSGLLTVRLTDVNDNDPVFQNTPYAGEVWTNDPAGITIATVSATDPDISNLPITYSIAGAHTTFSVDKLGVITLVDPVGLTSLSSPTVLQVQASDGGRTGTAAVTITIHADPCSSQPCQNGGTCSSEKGYHTCSCLSGYDGNHCQSVDYCYQGPCQNGGICINAATTYVCTTAGPTATPPTTPTTTPPTTHPTTPTNRPPGTQSTPASTTPTSTPTPTSCVWHPSSISVPALTHQTTGYSLGAVIGALCGGCIAGMILSAVIAITVYRRHSHHYIKKQRTVQLNTMTSSSGTSTAPGQEPAFPGHDVGSIHYETLTSDRSLDGHEYSVIKI